MKVKSESEVTQSCPTFSNPMGCSLPGSSIHGIFQARVLEWVAIAFSMTNLDSIFKSRDITLPTKVHLVKVMVFPVVMYGCKSLTVKKAEHQRIDRFELRCWRRSPLDCKEIQPVHSKGDQSWVFIGRTDIEAETPKLWPPDMKS